MCSQTAPGRKQSSLGTQQTVLNRVKDGHRMAHRSGEAREVALPPWELVLGEQSHPSGSGRRGDLEKQGSPGAPTSRPPGVAAFTEAQLLCVWAFSLVPLQPGLLLPIVAASLSFSGLLLLHLSPDKVLTLTAYILALATMLWCGLARGGTAHWGALFFAISAAVLAYHTIQPLPHSRLAVMTTYYAAQVLIALLAFQSPRLKTN